MGSIVLSVVCEAKLLTAFTLIFLYISCEYKSLDFKSTCILIKESIMTDVKNTVSKLNNGLSMPIFGLGTYESKPGEVEGAVKEALKCGYRHLDCASRYANEKEVGEGIVASGVPREEIFVTSKVWITKLKPSLVEKQCRKTLSDLGLKYLDLYLVHWLTTMVDSDEVVPKDENGKPRYDTSFSLVDTWKAMEDLVAKGLTKSIGISNFNSQQVEKICSNSTIKPVTNQVECHPFLNQAKLLKFCSERGVTLTAYSPLARAKPGEKSLFDQPKIKTIAEKYNKSPAQIVLRWQTQRGVITIPKSVTASRIQENAQVFDFRLTEQEMGEVDSLDCNGRIVIPPWSDHPEYPFNIEF